MPKLPRGIKDFNEEKKFIKEKIRKYNIFLQSIEFKQIFNKEVENFLKSNKDFTYFTSKKILS